MGHSLYVVFTMAVIFFAFFYTGMQYNPRDTADNLKKSGAFVPGYRPGEQTSRYIDKVMTLTYGALYIAFCLFGSLHHYVVMEGAVESVVHHC